MTIQVNIAEAKAKLSALIEAAERGEVVVIARNGEPVVHISPINLKRRRRPGILRELYGWTGPSAPIEAFAPDPADEEMMPIFPGDPTS